MTSQTIPFALLVATLLIAAFTDLRTGLVPNALTYPAAAIGLLYWTIACMTGFTHTGPLQSLLALALGLFPLWLIVRLGALGGGDAKLLGAVGAISASPACVLAALVYGLLIAILFAVGVMIRRRIVRQTLTRLATTMLLVSARIKPLADHTSPTIPFAAALALGGTLAGIEHLLHVRLPWSWVTA